MLIHVLQTRSTLSSATFLRKVLLRFRWNSLAEGREKFPETSIRNWGLLASGTRMASEPHSDDVHVMPPAETVRAIPSASASAQEFKVSFVLGLVLGVMSLVFFALYRFAGEERRRVALPLVTFIGFSCADAIYKAWAELETFYGSRPLEFALARTLLLCVTAWILGTRYFVKGEPDADGNAKKAFDQPLPPSQKVQTFFWFAAIGIIWGIEECLTAFPESFIGLIVSYVAMSYKFRTVGSRLGALFVPITIAGMLMARSGAVSLHSCLAGMVRILRLLLLDLVLQRVGPLSPLLLTWAPGCWASFVIALGYLIFEYQKPLTTPAETARGVLDYAAAAGFGMFFTLASTLAMFEMLASSSLFSLQAATCLIEIVVFCLLSPLAGLPLMFHVMLGLNITGVTLGILGSMIIIKTDKFASASRLAHTLLMFLQEEDVESQPSGSIREIGEDEWLLTMKQAPSSSTQRV